MDVDVNSTNFRKLYVHVDGKYPVTYKYTKCVESTFEGIEQGCVDLLELHWEHVMIDSHEWAQIAGYEN